MKTSLSVAQKKRRKSFCVPGNLVAPFTPNVEFIPCPHANKRIDPTGEETVQGGGSILRKCVDSNQTGKFLIFIFFVPHMFYLVFISICFAHIYSVSDLFLSAAFVAQILLTYCTPSLKKNCLF